MTRLVALLLCSMALCGAQAQRITYSEPDRDDARTLNFEVMGKMNGRILVYKSYRDQYFISVFDNEMKLVSKNKLDFFPERVLNTEFIQYPDFMYVFYQYQKRSVMYYMAARIGADGKKIGDVIPLDTTANINYTSNTKINSLIYSEDKQKIMVFKINSHNDRTYLVTTSLFDKDLKLLKKSYTSIPMPQRNDFLSEFTLDNDGDMVCVKASGTSQNDNLNKITLLTKPAMQDGYTAADLKLNNIYLDDIRIKVDNLNKHYLLCSFFSKLRRGNMEGLYYCLWDKQQGKEILTATTVFSDEFRADAKSDGNLKAAFNDFFLKNVVLRKDGGFLVMAESAYTTSRGNPLNRWDYLYGSPYWMPMDYYSWNSPWGYYPWWRYGAFNNALTRYFADNIAVISFDPSGKMEWSNVIRKSQYDDNTDNFIGYGMMNSGSEIHFIFNMQEKRDMILFDQSITPDGQINRNPTFKNMDKGYDFMPRHAKQVGAHQLVVPCQYRGYTCFAKIEF